LKTEERRRKVVIGEGGEEEEKRKRRRHYECTRRLYLYYRESKNLFRLEGSNSVPPLFILLSTENW